VPSPHRGRLPERRFEKLGGRSPSATATRPRSTFT
jgi:hypothetical protein